jgi:uncharacterized protein (TIGR02996 family)
MTPTEEGLLRASLLDPIARFVYADWLEEHDRLDEATQIRQEAGFVRRVEFSPAFDKRNSDATKDYGIHGVDLRMVLVGPRGAVQFLLYTGWMIPPVREELQEQIYGMRNPYPMPVDLGYHSKVPRYEDQKVQDENCVYLGGPCYYDGSSMSAQRAFDALTTTGDDGLWQFLKNHYKQVFEGQPEEDGNNH